MPQLVLVKNRTYSFGRVWEIRYKTCVMPVARVPNTEGQLQKNRYDLYQRLQGPGR